MQFPTFCKGTTARNYYYPHGIDVGAVNVPVTVGNVLVCPGDIIFGDRDGVVVIPSAIVKDLAEKIVIDLEHERKMRAKVEPGFKNNVFEELVARGYVVED